jgi:hypothetical protein
VLRWLAALEVANWLVDVLTGFVAVYLVDVAHYPAQVAALAVTIRMAVSAAGDLVLIRLVHQDDDPASGGAGDLVVLRVTAIAALPLYPAFLFVPGLAAKLVILAALSAATAVWYPLLQARLYRVTPSPVAVTLSSAASMAGGLGPLAVAVLAATISLTAAMASLAVAPLALLALTWSAAGTSAAPGTASAGALFGAEGGGGAGAGSPGGRAEGAGHGDDQASQPQQHQLPRREYRQQRPRDVRVAAVPHHRKHAMVQQHPQRDRHDARHQANQGHRAHHQS